MQSWIAIFLAALMAMLFVVWSAFRRLRRSEAYFRSLFENALELITILDPEGRIIYENPSNAKFVGYGRREMLGRNIFELIHPDDLPKVQAVFAEALAKPGGAPTIRFRLRHKDGTWHWIEAYGNNLLADRAVRGIVVNSRDVTMEVEDEARIKELNELRNKFVLVVSHQLRTPLSAIRWNLESLESGSFGKIPKKQLEPLRGALTEDVEVIRRINDMLTALDVEEGRLKLKRTPASLADVWLGILAGWKKTCAEKGLACDYDPPKRPLPKADLDVDRIREALSKLADNAVAYTREGGRVTARVEASGGRVRFEIEDTGVGIPKKDQERIFTRFFRASNASAMLPDANGISLSLARQFILAHGGTMGFTSQEGKGSLFWFEIPV
ncbi:MAG TPA: PAS domain-containing sensor histidine kinase [Candidatus Baltobacteraceae bacterium]|nr:PAS domain-containing sensor histidine kinase [Candidatus Baltobacteraceae bacterium]